MFSAFILIQKIDVHAKILCEFNRNMHKINYIDC